jgi:hypothetical protein
MHSKFLAAQNGNTLGSQPPEAISGQADERFVRRVLNGVQKYSSVLWNAPSFWALVVIVAAIVPRLLWIEDVEFKHDELVDAATIARLGKVPWSPLAGISAHSGIAQSSGFVNLLHLLVPDGRPLSIVSAIALLNTLSIVLPVWWLRRSSRHVFMYALCATSMTMILYSRKLWAPDLQAVWVCLSIGLLAAGRYRPDFRSVLLTGLAGFCLVMAGHMYLPAAFVAAVCCSVVTIALVAHRRWKPALAWVCGALAGWATFIPWALLILARAPGTHAASKRLSPFGLFAQWADAVHMGLTVHTPSCVYELYLRPILTAKFTAQANAFLNLTLFWIAVAVIAGMPLLAAAIWAAVSEWREAVRDPLVMTAVALLVSMPIALCAARLGTYVHYWLAVLPFFYYWIAWTVTRRSQRWREWTVVTCGASLLAFLSFAALVHENGGLPGEYGRSYHATRLAKAK